MKLALKMKNNGYRMEKKRIVKYEEENYIPCSQIPAHNIILYSSIMTGLSTQLEIYDIPFLIYLCSSRVMHINGYNLLITVTDLVAYY